MIKMVGYDMAKHCAEAVYKQAGLGPKDVQVVELHDCFTANELLTYEAGDVIVAEGAPGDSLFVLTTGTVKAFVKDPDGHYHKVREMYEGAFFGEVSILTGKPRSATITAATPCELLALDRSALESIAERQPNVMTILRHFCEARYGSVDEQQIRRGDTHPGVSRRTSAG